MLSADENRALTEVGRGTRMGQLLRRYWMPFLAAAELTQSTKAVRLLGEDLVVFRDGSGRYGLVERSCPHRGADLSLGVVQGNGLRCVYHGWCFDAAGACIEQPFERIAHPTAKDKVRAVAYPVVEKAGLLWAYLGPAPAPLVPDWDFFHDVGYKQIVLAEAPCNWVQCQENSIDPVHFEWLHLRWSEAQGAGGRPPKPHAEIAFEEAPHGFTYRRQWEGGSPTDELWTIGRVCLWPNALYTGFCEWRVPVDDTHTRLIAWFNVPLPGDEPFLQERIPCWTTPTHHPDGRPITSHVLNQDLITWIGQGRLADRSREHLGEGDRGVVMLRRKLFEQAQLVADGGEPMAVFRDPARNQRVSLPRAGRALEHPFGRFGKYIAETIAYGQPVELASDIERVWYERRPRRQP